MVDFLHPAPVSDVQTKIRMINLNSNMRYKYQLCEIRNHSNPISLRRDVMLLCVILKTERPWLAREAFHIEPVYCVVEVCRTGFLFLIHYLGFAAPVDDAIEKYRYTLGGLSVADCESFGPELPAL
mgnify:CR=1 FL=1